MPLRPTIRMEGGNKLEALLKKAQTANDLPSVEVGILPDTKFTGGQPVAPVAHKAEYGAPKSKRGPGQPPRPALRPVARGCYRTRLADLPGREARSLF